MTKHMINALTIENFKSIKTLELKPKRINLFVGKPNAGKSNILEALSLFSIPQQGDLRDINAAAEAKISLADYKLPAEAKELRSKFKRQEIEYDEDVWCFFKALDRHNPPHIQTLRAWIEEVQSVERP